MTDALTAGAMRRGRELIVAQKRTEALLEEYQSDGNEEGCAEAIGQLAQIRAEGQALNQLHQEHVQRTTPQYEDVATGAEWMGRPAHKMTGDDGLKIANYGKQPNDPTWISTEEYNKQVAVLRQKKANGDYQ